MTRPTKIVRQMNLRRFIMDTVKQRLTKAGFRTIKRHAERNSMLHIQGLRKKHRIELLKQHSNGERWILTLYSERMMHNYQLCSITDTDLAAPGSFEKIMDNIVSFLQKMQEIDSCLVEAHNVFEDSHTFDRRAYDPSRTSVTKGHV